MDELEQRLSSALTEMAEGVPPSHHAWAEQQRRLALKSRRNRLRPALVAAVAAAVVALIAVPVMILNLRGGAQTDVGAVPLVPNPPESDVQLPSSTKEQQVRYKPVNGEKLATEPIVVSSRNAGQRQYVFTYAYAVKIGDTFRACFADVLEGGEINGPDQGKFGEPACSPLSRPKGGRLDWGAPRLVPEASSGGGVVVYVMSQPAENLMLRQTNNKLVMAQQLGRGDEIVLFAAYLENRQVPIAFTVRDEKDNVLQNGP